MLVEGRRGSRVLGPRYIRTQPELALPPDPDTSYFSITTFIIIFILSKWSGIRML